MPDQWENTGFTIRTSRMTAASANQLICGANPARVGLWFPQTPDVIVWPGTNDAFYIFSFSLASEDGLMISYNRHGPVVAAEWYAAFTGVDHISFIETTLATGSIYTPKPNESGKKCWVFKDGIWQRVNNAT